MQLLSTRYNTASTIHRSTAGTKGFISPMATVRPFRGLYFDTSVVPLEDAIAPPYDVLSPNDQDELYGRSNYNIVRLILNRETPHDLPGDNRYLRAAAYLHDLQARNVIITDDKPSFYEYIQTFPHPLDASKSVCRTTLLTALKLENYSSGVVLPHEETLSKAKTDRLNLMRATHANPEPIYGLYEDNGNILSALLLKNRDHAAKILDTDYSGPGAEHTEHHTIYRHNSPDIVHAITEFFQGQRVWIADGHHRYETALNYQAERRVEEGDPRAEHEYDSILIGLSSFDDPGLVVLPTHRLVKNVSQERLQNMHAVLSKCFKVEELPLSEALSWIAQPRSSEQKFVLLVKDAAYCLTLLVNGIKTMSFAANHSKAWAELDVTVLQLLVLEPAFGLKWADMATTPDIAYTRDAAEAQQLVTTGTVDVACILQNPSVTDIRDVASAGDKMPQKSTFFYPKLYSGLIVRSLG